MGGGDIRDDSKLRALYRLMSGLGATSDQLHVFDVYTVHQPGAVRDKVVKFETN